MTLPRRLVAVILAVIASVVATIVVDAAPAAAETIRQQQWHLDALHVPKAQQITKGAGVVVAVIDTGVDASHPDLSGQVLAGTAMLGATNPEGETDPVGHGTLMAALIAGKGGGANHALGIAPQAKILPIAVPRVAPGSFAGPIRYAVDHGAKIINMSVGSPTAAPSDEVAAVNYARSKDVIIVAASGNRPDGDIDMASPGNIPGVIGVSGTEQDGSSWSGTISDPRNAVSAPAKGVVSALPKAIVKSGYGIGNGTSNSTAIVSGVLALIRSKYPDLNAANVVNRLFKTATDKGAPGRDPTYGFGIVDAYKAVSADVAPVTVDPLGPIVGQNGPAGRASNAAAGPGSSSDNYGWGSPLIRLGVVVAAFIVGLFILVMIIRWAARRRTPAAVPGGYPPGAPGGYPPGPPPGYPPAAQGGFPPGPPPGYPPGAPPGYSPTGYQRPPDSPPPQPNGAAQYGPPTASYRRPPDEG